MARYFFHITDGQVRIDREGTEFPDVFEVRKEAVRRAAAHLTDLDVGLLFGGPWTMTVANEDNRTVFSLQFAAQVYHV